MHACVCAHLALVAVGAHSPQRGHAAFGRLAALYMRALGSNFGRMSWGAFAVAFNLEIVGARRWRRGASAGIGAVLCAGDWLGGRTPVAASAWAVAPFNPKTRRLYRDHLTCTLQMASVWAGLRPTLLHRGC